MTRNNIVCTLVLLLALTACKTTHRSQSTELAMVPAEFSELTARGLEAVRMEEWLIAYDYFTAAQETAPTNPQALYNLAVACDRDGRDLEAAYWYRAYLATGPDTEASVAVGKAGSIVEARVAVAALLLWEQALINHEEDIAMIKASSETLALAGKLDAIIAWSREVDNDREIILAAAMETFGQLGDAKAQAMLIAEMPELDSPDFVEGHQARPFNKNTEHDTALGDWVERAGNLSPSLKDRTRDYVLNGVISGEGDDVTGLSEAAANLSQALRELHLTARYWRQRRQ